MWARGNQRSLFFTLRCYQRTEFNWFARFQSLLQCDLYVPHVSPYFMKSVIQHVQNFQESIQIFPDKPHSRASNYQRFRKLQYGISDAPSKSLQWLMGIEVVDDREGLQIVNRLLDRLFSDQSKCVLQMWMLCNSYAQRRAYLKPHEKSLPVTHNVYYRKLTHAAVKQCPHYGKTAKSCKTFTSARQHS